MAFEPNKENFMARLTATDFNVEDLLEDVDALQEVLWYLDSRRTREIVEAVFDAKTTTHSPQLIKNLAKLYPLSKPLIMSLMADVREIQRDDGKRLYRDASFLEGFDAAEETRRAILATFKEIGGRVIRLTKEVNKYQQTLEDLEGERARLNQVAGELEDLRRTRDELQAQVDKLREDTDEKKLREQNENLRVILEQLEGEKRRRQTEQQEKERRIAVIKNELKVLAEHTDSSEETRMIKDLLKKFPSDAEDFEQ